MKRLIYLPVLIPALLFSCQGCSQKYKNTTVTPYPDVAVGETENIIYTSSFHLAWKYLQDDILKDRVRVKENIPLVEILSNKEPVPVDERFSVNLAGFVKNGIDKKISDELKSKFNKEINLSKYTKDPSNIICYSFFRKEIRFKTRFEKFNQPFPFYSGGEQYDTECFGIWNAGESKQHQGLRELVKVIDYKNMADFIISISNPDENDEVIIAACTPASTFNETIDAIIRRIKNSEPTSLVNNDRLILPMVRIDAHKKYLELYGVHLINKNFEEYFFTEAAQDVYFELNESGAFADAEAKLIIEKGPGPRSMIINRPFLIMMREKQSDKPFFAAWIANPELLVQSE